MPSTRMRGMGTFTSWPESFHGKYAEKLHCHLHNKSAAPELCDFIINQPWNISSLTVQCLQVDSLLNVTADLKAKDSKGQFYVEGHPKRHLILNYCFSFAGEETLHGPIFIQEPYDITYSMGSANAEILLNCTAKGYPLPYYRWSQPWGNTGSLWLFELCFSHCTTRNKHPKNLVSAHRV